MNIKKNIKSSEKISQKSSSKKLQKSSSEKISRKCNGKKSPKNSGKKSPQNKIKIGQRVIVKPYKFMYLKEPDYIINIVVDSKGVYDYKNEERIYLDDYTIGIILDDGFIPIQNFIILKKKKGSIYETKYLKKINYKGSYVKYPKTRLGKEKFKISIDEKKKIRPNTLVAKVVNIDKKKKFIDLSIKKYYSYIE